MTVQVKGSIPANVLPFDADLQIDEGQYRRHLDWLAQAEVGGITTNGHAAQVSVLSREEWERALAIALETVGHWVPLVTGIYAESPRRPPTSLGRPSVRVPPALSERERGDLRRSLMEAGSLQPAQVA